MCMDCMISGIFFHNLALVTQGKFDKAVEQLGPIIVKKEDATDLATIGIGLIVNLTGPSCMDAASVSAWMGHQLWREHPKVAEWTISAIMLGLEYSGMEHESAMIELEVDTFVFSHDHADCIRMVASVVCHYYWCVVADHTAVLDYRRHTL